ncbi:hypothetical protein KC717_06235 [Candidatus Dojkabacteria bacterium]|uniref:Uncharacterized protein n=1 Tax=Candidatus Dojkabacteria bacterium TaxID=2099670 RepID=A0A955RKX0_9BACT|nr:hypothetical protein [Candidatus Dojkabacteria bacterium]
MKILGKLTKDQEWSGKLSNTEFIGKEYEEWDKLFIALSETIKNMDVGWLWNDHDNHFIGMVYGTEVFGFLEGNKLDIYYFN